MLPRWWNVFWDIFTAGAQKQGVPDAMIYVEVGFGSPAPHMLFSFEFCH
jgi:hypothetical protein